MNDGGFNLPITTSGDTSGVDKIKGAFDKLSASSGAMRGHADSLTGSLGGLKDKLAAAGEAAKNGETDFEAWKDRANEIGQAALAMGAQIGQAAAAFGPWGAALVVGAVAVRGLMDAVSSYNDVLDDTVTKEVLAANKTAEAAVEKRKAAENQKLSAEQIAAASHQSQIAHDEEAAAVKRAIAALKEETDLKARIAKSARELELAKIENDPNASDADKARQKAAFDKAELQAKHKAELDSAKAAQAQLLAGANEKATGGNGMIADAISIENAKKVAAEAAAVADEKKRSVGAGFDSGMVMLMRQLKGEVDMTGKFTSPEKSAEENARSLLGAIRSPEEAKARTEAFPGISESKIQKIGDKMEALFAGRDAQKLEAEDASSYADRMKRRADSMSGNPSDMKVTGQAALREAERLRQEAAAKGSTIGGMQTAQANEMSILDMTSAAAISKATAADAAKKAKGGKTNNASALMGDVNGLYDRGMEDKQGRGGAELARLKTAAQGLSDGVSQSELSSLAKNLEKMAEAFSGLNLDGQFKRIMQEIDKLKSVSQNTRQ